jgi:hypothetical protein
MEYAFTLVMLEAATYAAPATQDYVVRRDEDYVVRRDEDYNIRQDEADYAIGGDESQQTAPSAPRTRLN